MCNGREYLLRPGDLIIIPAQAPHSCNPRDGRPRSYAYAVPRHDVVPATSAATFPESGAGARAASVDHAISGFSHNISVVVLMEQQKTAAAPRTGCATAAGAPAMPARHYRCALPVRQLFRVAWRPVTGTAHP
ncbi:hypothetical protein DMH17_16380 [Raoultella planticola]|nr:hypothetical protein [Raoultella planticola]